VDDLLPDLDGGHEPRAGVDGPSWTVDKAGGLALRILGQRELTRAELTARLARRGVDEDTCAEVLAQLERARLVDDELYARLWVDSRHHGKGLPRATLARELRRKGVDEALVQTSLAGIDAEAETAAARALLVKRLPSVQGLSHEAAYRRLTAFLARKGFHPGQCAALVTEALRAYSG
jgi:regulatory protein